MTTTDKQLPLQQAPLRVLGRYLDVVLVIVAAAPVIALGAPTFGYVMGAGGWILQRIVAETDKRLIGRHGGEPRRQVGMSLFESFGRIWLLAGMIVIAGVVGGRPDGLCAAVVIFGAYSVAFAVKLIGGQPDGREPEGRALT